VLGLRRPVGAAVTSPVVGAAVTSPAVGAAVLSPVVGAAVLSPAAAGPNHRDLVGREQRRFALRSFFRLPS